MAACERCDDTRLKLGGWMGPTPVRPLPDPCPECSPALEGFALQAHFIAYVTEPGRFDPEGQARMLLEPPPAPAVGKPTGERFHGVYCPTCDWRTTYFVVEGGVAVCDSCHNARPLKDVAPMSDQQFYVQPGP